MHYIVTAITSNIFAILHGNDVGGGNDMVLIAKQVVVE
jgi:hypothetical protein